MRIISILAHVVVATTVGACAGASVDASSPNGCTKEPVRVRENESCAEIWRSPCGMPSGVNPADGLSEEECRKVCGTLATKHMYYACELLRRDDLPPQSFGCSTCVASR
jgi:hypothetical protein